MNRAQDRFLEDPRTKQLVAVSYAGMCREYPGPKAQFSNSSLYFHTQKDAVGFYIGKGWREITRYRKPA